jgi:hypothetical protein
MRVEKLELPNKTDFEDMVGTFYKESKIVFKYNEM